MSDGLLALAYTAVEGKIYISGYGVSVESSVPANVFPSLMTTGANCATKSFMSKQMNGVNAEESSGEKRLCK